MDEKYLNKYRIPSNRLQSWDYGNNGIYFITICTHNKEHFFGKVLNGEMQLNEIGLIANKLWTEIPKQFPFIESGKFVIMPNHIHGLLTVETQFIASGKEQFIVSEKEQFIAPGAEQFIAPEKEQSAHKNRNAINCASVDQSDAMDRLQPDAINCVSTIGGFAGNKNPLLNQNISRVIRWYKGRCTFDIRKIHADFLWQTRFYDHIVRNQKSLENIEDYIDSNPSKWHEDKFYKKYN